MTELPVLLQQFVTRYRTALLARAGVLAALSVGVLGALAWRLYPLRVPPLWGVWVLAGAAVATACSIAWWVRRRWISPGSAASYLDRTLDLQQRLLTAAEFAQASQKPLLYPQLVDDVAQRYTTRQLRFPRPADRTAGILTAILFVILFWPGVRPPVYPRMGVKLASVPPTPPIPQSSPTPTPPTPEQRSEQQRQQASSQQPSPSSQASQSQPTSGGTGSSAANQDGAQSKDSSGRRGEEGRGDGQRAEQSQPSDDGRESSPKNTGSQDSSRGEAQGAQGDSGTQQRSAGNRQAEGSEEGSRAQTRSNDSHQQGAAQQQGQRGAAERSPSQADAHQSTASQQGQQGGRQPTTGGGSALSAADQEALKAQIQELLKEVSGELKDLQAQLASANDQPKPQAGTGTDPNLYEGPTPMERPSGAALPIQLQTDTVQTKSQRPGSGTGKPSGEASSSAPQTSAEEASLSDAPLEESSASREVVPPEYRTIFEQLRSHSSQPSEKSP